MIKMEEYIYGAKGATDAQKMIQYQLITAPVAASAVNILNAFAGPTSAAALLKTNGFLITAPDFPRNIVVTPGGTTTDIEAFTMMIMGKNILNEVITEDFVFLADATNPVVGLKAFASITSVYWAANAESGGYAATWSIGFGAKFGFRYNLEQAGHVVFTTCAGAYETVRPTVTASLTAICLNTIDFNGTKNGSNNFEIFYVSNYKPL